MTIIQSKLKGNFQKFNNTINFQKLRPMLEFTNYFNDNLNNIFNVKLCNILYQLAVDNPHKDYYFLDEAKEKINDMIIKYSNNKTIVSDIKNGIQAIPFKGSKNDNGKKYELSILLNTNPGGIRYSNSISCYNILEISSFSEKGFEEYNNLRDYYNNFTGCKLHFPNDKREILISAKQHKFKINYIFKIPVIKNSELSSFEEGVTKTNNRGYYYHSYLSNGFYYFYLYDLESYILLNKNIIKDIKEIQTEEDILTAARIFQENKELAFISPTFETVVSKKDKDNNTKIMDFEPRPLLYILNDDFKWLDEAIRDNMFDQYLAGKQ